MNPAYTLAYKLGIPVIVQPEWNECHKLQEEGRKLWKEGYKLREEGWGLRKEGLEIWEEEGKIQDEWQRLQEEGYKLQDEWWRLQDEGQKLYKKAVTRELGPEYVERIDWITGEVRPL